jgi:hypothetical protein
MEIMLRKVLTALVSSALAFGVDAASAQSDLAKQSSPVPARSPAAAISGPLSAGGPAGIKQAQGAERNRIWNYVPFGVVGGLALLVVLATGDDDDETTTTTTGSN